MSGVRKKITTASSSSSSNNNNHVSNYAPATASASGIGGASNNNNNSNSSSNAAGSSGGAVVIDQTRRRIIQMEAEREERRRAMVERKKAREEEEQRNIAAGNPGDVDFIGMVRTWRNDHANEAMTHESTDEQQHPRICICVRKRPINDKEIAKQDHDSVTILNPTAWIHSAKYKVDGISKYLDHTSYQFDHAFDESVTTEEIYKHTTMPLLDYICAGIGGRATVFAYGQTGSGKTYTMNGIQEILIEDLFLLLSESPVEDPTCCTLENTVVTVSFFEMYGGYLQDLLNERNRLKILEDGKGEIHVSGLLEMEVCDPASFSEIVAAGNNARTTHMTEANDTSSRSHAICQIFLKDRKNDKLRGKLSLVDLAGSERGTDTKSHNAQRRAESSDINTSLLALKECIRALHDKKGSSKGQHVPYRGSKLTLILKDCFTSEHAMTTMIATVSPGASSADHSINTLRYADRIKSKGSAQSATTTSSSSLGKSPVRTNSGRRISPAPSSGNGSMSSLNISNNKTKKLSPPIVQQSSDNDLYEKNDRNGVILSQQQQQRNTVDFVTDDADEILLRQTVEAIFEQEELILSTHMSNIQQNAELLTLEGDLLSTIQQRMDLAGGGVPVDDVDAYATALEEILNQKEDMINNLQNQITCFQNHLQTEKELSKKLGYIKTPRNDHNLTHQHEYDSDENALLDI